MFKLTSRVFTRVNFQQNSVRSASNQAYTDALALLKKDLKKAMLAKDNTRKTTIRNLLSTIKNREIDNKDKDFDEFMLFDVYSKLISQRKDSIAEFIKNSREDLVDNEKREMGVIQEYLGKLPVASNEEIDAKVLEFLNGLKETQGALQLKQIFGKVDWKSIPLEWKASPSAIRSSIVTQFKNVFG